MLRQSRFLVRPALYHIRTATTFSSTKSAVKPVASASNGTGSPSSSSGVVRSSFPKESEQTAAEVWKEFDDTPGDAVNQNGEDWAKSFAGLGHEAFPEKVVNHLLADTVAEDIEITPDGLLYLPEIKYRRILNKAFGPGGWGLAPRSPTVITPKTVSREYGLVCQGRLVAVARGEQQYFNPDGVPTAIEGCKSNALMRCCKDLGVASELWDPRFIRTFKKNHCDEKWFEKKRRFVWKRKDSPWEYPYK